MLLSTTAELRPTAIQLTKISYFDDVGVKTLNNLDSQFQWDNVQVAGVVKLFFVVTDKEAELARGVVLG